MNELVDFPSVSISEQDKANEYLRQECTQKYTTE